MKYRLTKLRGGKSRQQIAMELDIPLNTYTHYEYGDRKPSHKNLIKISKFYGVSVDYILGINPQTKTIENETRLLSAFNKCNEINQARIIGYVESTLEQQNTKTIK